MKKLINDHRRFVPELLSGLVRVHPGLHLIEDQKIVYRAGNHDEVAVISGGGAGHEPAHGGYVGPGLLRAAVSGDVFASPGTDAVLAAIRTVGTPAGVLLVVKNYTGDRLNFGLAAELARAEGIPCEMVIVADDLALQAGDGHAGRRGLAGTILVHKVAGAAAARGSSLEVVADAARRASGAVGTVGLALSGCTVPGVEASGFSLREDEVELGLGIHGERGVSRQPLRPADGLVAAMLEPIVAGLGLAGGERVVLLVNNLGATPPSELLVVTNGALDWLDRAGIVVERCWSGPFLTALDMQGCSLSLMRCDGLLAWLDAAALAPAWPGAAARPARLEDVVTRGSGATTAPAAGAGRDQPLARAIVAAVAAALERAEPELTRLDQAVGDGDLGLSLQRGARAILAELGRYDLQDPAATLEGIAGTVRRSIGGTSGPLYAVLLLRAATRLRQATGRPDAGTWAEALEAGWQAISDLGDAQPGDRTMLDALAPAAAALRQAAAEAQGLAGALRAAIEAAGRGAQATAGMVARRGRSSYLADRLGDHPDPGAVAVAIWLRAIGDALDRGAVPA